MCVCVRVCLCVDVCECPITCVHVALDHFHIFVELTIANDHYHDKLQSTQSSSNAKTLFDAGWKVEELSRLMSLCQKLIATISQLIEVVPDNSIDMIIAGQLSEMRDMVTTFIHDLSRHQRQVATHIFVLMISCEQRDAKPYAIPVQCLPYKSINQQHMREIVNNLMQEMISTGMKVAGKFCVVWCFFVVVVVLSWEYNVTQGFAAMGSLMQ